jgi:hypothetical protein
MTWRAAGRSITRSIRSRIGFGGIDPCASARLSTLSATVAVTSRAQSSIRLNATTRCGFEYCPASRFPTSRFRPARRDRPRDRLARWARNRPGPDRSRRRNAPARSTTTERYACTDSRYKGRRRWPNPDHQLDYARNLNSVPPGHPRRARRECRLEPPSGLTRAPRSITAQASQTISTASRPCRIRPGWRPCREGLPATCAVDWRASLSPNPRPTVEHQSDFGMVCYGCPGSTTTSQPDHKGREGLRRFRNHWGDLRASTQPVPH